MPEAGLAMLAGSADLLIDPCMLQQGVYGRLTDYEDVNDAGRLDPPLDEGHATGTGRIEKNPALAAVCDNVRGFANEADGIRTRNHRIDSPVL